jgi:hypothetical protein
MNSVGSCKVELFYHSPDGVLEDYSDVLKDKFLINLYKPTTKEWKNEIKDILPAHQQRLKATVKKSLLKPPEKKEAIGIDKEKDIYFKEVRIIEIF